MPLAVLSCPVAVLAVPLAVLLPLPLLLYHVRRLLAPAHSLFRALAGSVASYRDGDYSFGVAWEGGGELGELVAAHRSLGDTLRDQRLRLVQRELLLDTIVQNNPVAMLLVDPSGHVVLGNLAARKLLGDGRRLEGASFAENICRMVGLWQPIMRTSTYRLKSRKIIQTTPG